MNDMSTTIIAKSDQINAADLIGTSRTITIKEVRIKAGEDQPVSVLIEGDKKAFRPCKGVRRLMVRVWGADASKYIGESMTIFCDPSVTWAGKEEGGIRVSHMTGLDEKIIEYMRVNRAGTKPYEIFPLKKGAAQGSGQSDDSAKWTATFVAKVGAINDLDALDTYEASKAKLLGELSQDRPELHQQATDAVAARRFELSQEGRADQHGESHTTTDIAQKLIGRLKLAKSLAGVDALETEYTEAAKPMLEPADQELVEIEIEAARAQLAK